MLKKIAILILCSIIFTGCTQKQDKQEISFSSWGSVTEVKILENIISEFEKENPNTKINFIHIPQNYFQKLHLLFASNTAPDVVFINNLYLPLYANQLKDLSNKINQNDYYNQPLKALSYDNKILAIPRDASNLILYINTDIVKLSPKTLDELLEISLQIKEQNKYGISFEEDIYWASPYLSYYGEAFDEKFNVQDSQGFLFYKELRDKYKVAPTKSQVGSSTLAQMFLDEKIAMYLSGRWMYPKINEKAKFNWIVAPFPYGKTPQACDASGWAISKATKNEKLALDFVKFLSNEKNIKYFTETGLIVPANKKIAQKLNNKQHNEFVFLEVLRNSQKMSIPKTYKKLIDDFNMKNF